MKRDYIETDASGWLHIWKDSNITEDYAAWGVETFFTNVLDLKGCAVHRHDDGYYYKGTFVKVVLK